MVYIFAIEEKLFKDCYNNYSNNPKYGLIVMSFLIPEEDKDKNSLISTAFTEWIHEVKMNYSKIHEYKSICKDKILYTFHVE